MGLVAVARRWETPLSEPGDNREKTPMTDNALTKGIEAAICYHVDETLDRNDFVSITVWTHAHAGLDRN
jgi:hypothetical protein